MLSSPKSTAINEMNKRWDLQRKNSWLMYISFIFPSFFSSYNSNSAQFTSVTQSCQTLCNSMDCSTPGLSVHHQLPEFTQTHVHWVGDAIQPSHPVVPFSSCLQSFPTLGSFQMSQFFVWGGQSIGVSASASVLPMNTQNWFPLGWTGWISLEFKGPSRVLSLLQHHSSKASILQHSAFSIVQLLHPYMTTGKTIALERTRW